MTDTLTVKLIIELPTDKYLSVKTNMINDFIYDAVKHGTPLDDVKAEIEKEIIPRNSDDYDHDAMYQNCGLRIALKIIDKHIGGDK